MDKPNLSHFEIKFDIKTSDDNIIDLITSISGAVNEALKGSILKGSTTVIPTVTVMKNRGPLFNCCDCGKFIKDAEFYEIYRQLDNIKKISLLAKDSGSI